MNSAVQASDTDDLDRVLHSAMSDESLELPPPPQVVSEVMRLTRGDAAASDSPDASTTELAQLIQRDMAIAGQVMRVANSAVYARRSPVVTLPQAIAWLGIREIRNIAFAVALKGQVFTSAYFRNELADLWRESVITALFAQEIARLKRRNVESAYLCGLLHRAGMAVILNRVGSAVLKQRLTPDSAQVLKLAERHEARVGTHLSIAWQLPPSVSAAISHWRDPPAAELARTEVMEVALARQISDESRTPGAGGELPDSMLGPVSRWMDELSIYPDELFSIMAQRAAIYATAESFVTSNAVGLHFDVVVIGSGPAGQKAAIQAAKAGKGVAVIERDRHVGGSCVHTGTIPSKSLREHAMRQRVRHVNLMDEPIQSLLDGVAATIAAHDSYMAAQLDRNHIMLLRGRASFLSPHELALRRIDGSQTTVRANAVIIATGSRPRTPPHLAVDHEHILDSDSILSLAYLPRSLLVLGGGVIGSEYASTFTALGCKVTQADQLDRPLAFLDSEFTSFYVEELRRNGGEYISRAEATSTKWDGISQVRTGFKDGRSISADKVLVALGRVANVDGLKLEAAGVALTNRGHVQVDENMKTTANGVYAAGDVIGPPALASVSMEQGRRAACHALGLLVPSDPVSRLPAGVYTIPEIATVGLDEHGARRHFGGAIVGRARFEEIARGQINGCQRGLLKLVADPGGRRVVGVQIAGDGATELVHIGQLGLAAELDVDAYVDNVFNFPTMAEAYRIAAFDIVKQRGQSTTSDSVADAVSAVL